MNGFLLYYDATEAKDGAGSVGMFFRDWFIRKAAWASEGTIKANAGSLKKFYTFMHEQGLVDQEELKDLKESIKEYMPEWVRKVRRYNKF